MAQEATEFENMPKRVVPRRRAKDMVSKVIADMTTDHTLPMKRKKRSMKKPRDPNMPRLIEQKQQNETAPCLKDSEACTSEPFPDVKMELMEVDLGKKSIAVVGFEGVSGSKIPLQDIEELTNFKTIQFGMYVCEFCSTRLKNYSDYTSHIATHNECHSVCCMCPLPETPFSITAFSKHAITHFEAINGVYNCRFCTEKTRTNKSFELIQHLYYYCPNIPKCLICICPLADGETVDSHRQERHKRLMERFLCVYCLSGFPSLTFLEQHVCKTTYRCICDLCVIFNSPEEADAHTATNNSEDHSILIPVQKKDDLVNKIQYVINPHAMDIKQYNEEAKKRFFRNTSQTPRSSVSPVESNPAKDTEVPKLVQTTPQSNAEPPTTSIARVSKVVPPMPNRYPYPSLAMKERMAKESSQMKVVVPKNPCFQLVFSPKPQFQNESQERGFPEPFNNRPRRVELMHGSLKSSPGNRFMSNRRVDEMNSYRQLQHGQLALTNPSARFRCPISCCKGHQMEFDLLKVMEHLEMDHFTDKAIEHHHVPRNCTLCVCRFCMLTFESRTHFEVHIQCHTSSHQIVKNCPDCSFIIEDGAAFINHRMGGSSWYCRQCDSQFSTEIGFFYHVATRTDHGEIFYFCKGCEVGNTQPESVIQHISMNVCSQRAELGFLLASSLRHRPLLITKYKDLLGKYEINCEKRMATGSCKQTTSFVIKGQRLILRNCCGRLHNFDENDDDFNDPWTSMEAPVNADTFLTIQRISPGVPEWHLCLPNEPCILPNFKPKSVLRKMANQLLGRVPVRRTALAVPGPTVIRRKEVSSEVITIDDED
ncbi:hypothetical protein FO519_005662 [Halicephalobus sp. NKZ332]|nr:hypothetical protein FO519_005662 [Halicephalobus sp. NKZ332]